MKDRPYASVVGLSTMRLPSRDEIHSGDKKDEAVGYLVDRFGCFFPSSNAPEGQSGSELHESVIASP